ncbi:murein transglycosylase A [Rhodoferax sediminis]|uniref:peptidoglycan lytic exotransglycosylase n=1 Tax=Rhodoferax sediminis TaxID=2509614 RepID=A0A515D6H2_9BURK|nr:MltA domain-containing protein [Rhodoferax sediminis]QDL35978.1 transglycosylase [Rhodoferax sediminis]
MVHQTISSSAARAASASTKSKIMNRLLWRLSRCVASAAIVGTLWGCASAPPYNPAREAGIAALAPGALPGDNGPLPPALQSGKSRWVPVRWADLPGFADDPLFEAWNAWIKSCERPGPTFAPLCAEVRRLSIGTGEEQRAWMMQHLQPYRVEPLAAGSPGASEGLLTGYYEPLMDASRLPGPGYTVPLYRPPAGLNQRRPWYTRQQIDTLPEARAALRGNEIAYVADPIDALILQIQGSGRLRIAEPDGSQHLVRLAFAGTNDQPYQSVGRWLLDQGATRDATWPGIRAWLAQNPQRMNELLWSNPRVVFFREEPLSELDAAFGPRGAQGVALTPGRSIAVDAASIPYGTPVWLASSGAQVNLQKLVLAQDTGSAIVGAVRADYFAGWGAQAGELAGRLKQPLKLWVLWPKQP